VNPANLPIDAHCLTNRHPGTIFSLCVLALVLGIPAGWPLRHSPAQIASRDVFLGKHGKELN